MVWLVLAAAAVAATAVLFAAALRLTSAVSFGLAAYLLASAEVIALTEVLSLLGLARAAGYAVGEALLFAAALAAWHVRGRPRPPLPRPGLVHRLRAHPLLEVLVVIVGIALVYEGVLVFATPPNNWDSMSYHLSRAAAWYQRHRVEYVPAHTERQNAFQPNSEMEILYTFAFAGRDTAAAATQLLAELAMLLGIYGCARRLGYARPAALFASLLTATLTEIALQSITTQNDLLAASFVVCAACLALGEARMELAVAGLAVGLAAGTKLITGPALVLVALLALSRRPRRTRLAVLAVASAIGFAAVGFYGYGLNLIETGRPLGDPTAQDDTRPEKITFTGTISTAARIGFRFFDFSGYDPPGWMTSPIRRAGKDVFAAFGIRPNPIESTQTRFSFSPKSRVNEDISFFGPLGFLLVLPLAACFLVGGALRRAPPAAVVLAAAVPLYAVALAFGFRYNIWLGRFMVAPVALTMPLAAFVYRWRPIAVALAVVGVLGLYYADTRNDHKPVGFDQRPAVWGMPRLQEQTLPRPHLLRVFRGVERYVPPTAELGVALRFDDWDYPLYGPTLKRRVVPVPRVNMLEFAERHHLRWILLSPDAFRPPPPANWRIVRFKPTRWTMYLRAEERG